MHAKNALAMGLGLIASCSSNHEIARSWRYDLDAACEAICNKEAECGEEYSSWCQPPDCDDCHEQCVSEVRARIDIDNEFCQTLLDATVECSRESTCAAYYQGSGGPASCDRMERAARACIDEEEDIEPAAGASASGVAYSAVATASVGGDGTSTTGSISTITSTVGAVTSGVGGAGGAGDTGGVDDGDSGSGMGGTSTNSDPLIIDDFEDGDRLLDPNYTGTWYVAVDPEATGEVGGDDLQEPFPETLDPRRADSGYGMHLSGEWGGWGVALGCDFRADGGPIDGSLFAGVSFWAKASAGSVHVVVATDITDAGGNQHAVDATVTDNWSQVTIFWEDFSSDEGADLPWTPTALTGIQFRFGNAPFDVWIDDVRFVQ